MRKLTILIILLVTAVVVLPQEPPKKASAQSDAQKTAANNIIVTEQQFWEALKNKDGKFFEANLPDDLVAVGYVGVLTKSTAVNLFFKMPCEVRSFTLTDFKVTFFTSETAFLTYKGATDGTCAGKAVPTVWASAVYVKRHERWLKASHQETRAVTAAVGLPEEMKMPAPKTSGPQSDAQKAFEMMKTMVGSWDGSIVGLSTHITIRVTSSGNAILHEATGSRPDNPITMFYVDGDRLLLTHYCDAGNRPRMVGKISPDGKTVEFEFLDVSGSTERGMMNHMVFTVIDANHHSEAATWMLPGNKPMVAQFILTRTK